MYRKTINVLMKTKKYQFVRLDFELKQNNKNRLKVTIVTL